MGFPIGAGPSYVADCANCDGVQDILPPSDPPRC
jgi:hypothetical protein